MTKLGSIDLGALGPGTESHPGPEKVVSGSPVFTLWPYDTDPNKKVRCGIWQATPGAYRLTNRTVWESFTILEGLVEITEDGQETKTYRAGDTVILRVGLEATWNTIETVRKFYVVVE